VVRLPYSRPDRLGTDDLHVSPAAFEAFLAVAAGAGLVVRDRPRIGPNKAALLAKPAS